MKTVVFAKYIITKKCHIGIEQRESGTFKKSYINETSGNYFFLSVRLTLTRTKCAQPGVWAPDPCCERVAKTSLCDCEPAPPISSDLSLNTELPSSCSRCAPPSLNLLPYSERRRPSFGRWRVKKRIEKNKKKPNFILELVGSG